MSSSLLTAFTYSALLVSGQQMASDPGVYGPPLELVHSYNDQFPTGNFMYTSGHLPIPYKQRVFLFLSIFDQPPGIAVSATGRLFSNYPPTLDSNNTKYGVAELTSSTSEIPYPSKGFNSSPGGFINHTSTSPSQFHSALEIRPMAI